MPYYVVQPHPNTPKSVQPKIRKSKPDLSRPCWSQYDYVQGPFETKSKAERAVIDENKFRSSNKYNSGMNR